MAKDRKKFVLDPEKGSDFSATVYIGLAGKPDRFMITLTDQGNEYSLDVFDIKDRDEYELLGAIDGIQGKPLLRVSFEEEK